MRDRVLKAVDVAEWLKSWRRRFESGAYLPCVMWEEFDEAVRMWVNSE